MIKVPANSVSDESLPGLQTAISLLHLHMTFPLYSFGVMEGTERSGLVSHPLFIRTPVLMTAFNLHFLSYLHPYSEFFLPFLSIIT